MIVVVEVKLEDAPFTTIILNTKTLGVSYLDKLEQTIENRIMEELRKRVFYSWTVRSEEQ